MIKKGIFVLMFILACGIAQATTVYLKNGSSISGKLISRTADNVKIDVSGVALTYYNDEIDRVEGEDAQATESAPKQSAPAASEKSPVAAVAVSDVSKVPADQVAPVVAEHSVPSAADSVPKVLSQVNAAPTVPASQPGPISTEPVDPYAGMTKESLILKFIDVFGTKRMMTANFDQMVKSMPLNQAVVVKRMIKVDEIIKELLPVYAKHFSEADLKALIDFYSTPVGRKLVDSLPLLMNESVQVSAKYFEAHMQELAGGLKEAGVGSKSPKP